MLGTTQQESLKELEKEKPGVSMMLLNARERGPFTEEAVRAAKRSKQMRTEKMSIEFHSTEVNDLHKMPNLCSYCITSLTHLLDCLCLLPDWEGCGLL